MSFINNTLFFLKNRNVYTFSGSDIECEIIYNKDGTDWLKAFRLFDEKGKRIIETKHPETLMRLIKAKNCLTFQIKEWAQGRADGTLPLIDFSERLVNELYHENKIEISGYDMETQMKLPKWVINAVETQKKKYYTFYDNKDIHSCKVQSGR